MENQVVYKAIDRSKGCSVAWIEWELQCFPEGTRAKKAKQLISRLEHFSKLKSEHLVALINDGEGSFIQNGDVVLGIAELMCTTLKGYSNSFNSWKILLNFPSFLEKAGGVSVATIQEWGIQICKGLNFLHTASPQIVHRNLKLESIFYDAKEARLKIGLLSSVKILSPDKALPKRKKGNISLFCFLLKDFKEIQTEQFRNIIYRLDMVHLLIFGLLVCV